MLAGSDEIVGREGGFLAIRRLRLRNLREDQSHSQQYLCDYIVRPKGRPESPSAKAFREWLQAEIARESEDAVLR